MTNLTNLRNSSPTRPLNLLESLPPISPPASGDNQKANEQKQQQISLANLKSRPGPKSSVIVNERSDSGISECSANTEDYSRRRSTTSLHSFINSETNHSPSSGISMDTKDGKTSRLNWQNSVDSAVGDEEPIKNQQPSYSPTDISPKDNIIKSGTCPRQTTHSRV